MVTKQRLTGLVGVFVASLISVLMLLTSVRAAGSASFSLTPNSGTLTKDTTLTVTVVVSTSDQINMVQSNLTYDQSQLEFVNIDASSSAFDLPFPSSGSGGKVTIVRGTSGGTVSGSQTVAKVSFKVIGGSGSTAVSFASDSLIVRPSDGQNIWNGVTTGGAYTLTTPTLPTPQTPSTPSSQEPTPTSTTQEPASTPSTSTEATPSTASSPTSSTRALPAASSPSIAQQQADPSVPIPVSTKSLDAGNLVAVKVVDKDQNPIEGAEVTLGEKTAISDTAGVASFAGIEPGEYEVTIKSSKGEVKASVTVVEGSSTAEIQEYTLAVKPNNSLLYVAIAGGVLIVVAGVYFIRKRLRGGGSHGSLYMNGKKVNPYQVGQNQTPASSSVAPANVPPAEVSLEKIKVNLPQPSTVITPESPPQQIEQK